MADKQIQTPFGPERMDDLGGGTFARVMSQAARQYDLANALRVPFSTTSSAAIALPALNSSREVVLHTTTECWVKFGPETIAVAAMTDADLFPVTCYQGLLHMRVPDDATHVRVISDGAEDVFRLIPVI